MGLLTDFLDGLRGGGIRDAEDRAFVRALFQRAGVVTDLTGEPLRDVLQRAVANHVEAVRLSYIRGGHVLFVEADGSQKRLKLPRKR